MVRLGLIRPELQNKILINLRLRYPGSKRPVKKELSFGSNIQKMELINTIFNLIT